MRGQFRNDRRRRLLREGRLAAMSSYSRVVRGCALGAALLLAGLPLVSQDYEAKFVNGVRAMDGGNWQLAISAFRAAIATRPQETSDPVQVYGMRTRPYLPHYYLGFAYASSGQCAAAIEEFAVSEQQGAIQKGAEYKSLLMMRARCLAPTPEPTVEVVITPASIPLLTPPRRAATPGADARVQAARAPSLPAETATPKPALVKQKVPQPAVVPPYLLKGASAYFAGDYAVAAQTLSAEPDSLDRGAAAQARLFRSAARFALYIVGGAKDGNLQQSALRDAFDCRHLDPNLVPTPADFSPRFVEFFNRAVKPSRPAS